MEEVARHILFSNGLFSPLLVVIGIPVYLLLVHSRTYYHIPGTFKRMGMGICLTTFSLAASLAMEVVVHAKVKGIKCMFAGLTHSFPMGNSIDNKSHYVGTSLPLYQNIYFFRSQHFLSNYKHGD